MQSIIQRVQVPRRIVCDVPVKVKPELLRGLHDLALRPLLTQILLLDQLQLLLFLSLLNELVGVPGPLLARRSLSIQPGLRLSTMVPLSPTTPGGAVVSPSLFLLLLISLPLALGAVVAGLVPLFGALNLIL